MKLKSFKKYSEYYSKDPNTFMKRIALTSNEALGEIFEITPTSESAFQLPKDIPVISWGKFSFGLNENFCSTVYNQGKLPSRREIDSRFGEESFIPKKVDDRTLVKKMKFPIIGLGTGEPEEFKTYGKFKKSEKTFDYFKEKPVPTSRFEILASRKNPIHIQKRILGTPFDVEPKRWKYLEEASNICSRIADEYSPDFYVIQVIESNGKLYLENVTRDIPLSPSQSVKLYESAYQKYYSAGLPDWFRKKLFHDHVKPYYSKRYYDSLLLNPSGVIDFKKYV